MRTPCRERNREITSLRREELWTLEELAEKYGLSRQRVGQIVGGSDRKSASTKRRRLAAAAMGDKPGSEVAQALGVTPETVRRYRQGVYHRAEPGETLWRRHDDWLRWLRDTLEELGHMVTLQSTSSPFDMLVGSKRVSVASASRPINPPSKKTKSPSWRFSIPHPPCGSDFLICVTSNKDSFVIPADKLPNTANITFCYPSLRESLGKWQQYHGRYDLLGQLGETT